ncbi:MAG: hypothetical protein WBB82_04410 [Limnothrix sp.]
MATQLKQQLNLLLKIFLLSAVGSAVIKYAVPYGFSLEAIAPSQIGAFAAILLPSVVLAVILWWRARDKKSVT